MILISKPAQGKDKDAKMDFKHLLKRGALLKWSGFTLNLMEPLFAVSKALNR